MTTDAPWADRDILDRLRAATFDSVTAEDLRDAVAEIERLRRELAIARINPEDYMDADGWSDDCRGTMTPVAQHDLCDDPECGCPCHERAES